MHGRPGLLRGKGYSRRHLRECIILASLLRRGRCRPAGPLTIQPLNAELRAGPAATAESGSLAPRHPCPRQVEWRCSRTELWQGCPRREVVRSASRRSAPSSTAPAGQLCAGEPVREVSLLQAGSSASPSEGQPATDVPRTRPASRRLRELQKSITQVGIRQVGISGRSAPTKSQ